MLGAAWIAAAALFSLEFVQEHVSEDGEVEPEHAAALQIVRLVLATFGVCQIAAATALPRLSAVISTFLSSPKRSQWTIFLMPIATVTLLFLYKTFAGLDDPIYWILVREDSFVEWATVLAFLASFGVFGSVAGLAPSLAAGWLRVYYAVLSLFCLFVALEEISYGQRILGLETPSVLSDRNTQDETNLHNIVSLSFVSFYLGPWCLGVFGALGCVFLWLRHRVGHRAMILLSLVLPPLYLSSWYVPYALFAFYDRFAWGSLPLIEWQDSEVLEALLACGFLGFAFHARSNLRRVQEASEACPLAVALNAEKR